MAIAVARKLGAEISEALGLKNVQALDLHVAIGEIVTVTVKYYPEVDGVMQFPAILKQYELKEKAE